MTLQEILFFVAIGFFVLAAIFIAIAAVTFFVNNVPDVRDDLSGKKRQTEVAKIANQRPGRDRRKGAARNEPTSGNLMAQPGAAQQIADQQAQAAAAPPPRHVSQPAVAAAQPQPRYERVEAGQPDDGPTTVLADDDSETSILPDDASSTTVLEDDSSATAVLAQPVEEREDVTAVLAEEVPGGTSGAGVEATSFVEAALPAAAATAAATAANTFQNAYSDDSQTTILPSAASEAPAVAEQQFEIVRKIVLMESTQFVKAG